jgi:hypothetical protein
MRENEIAHLLFEIWSDAKIKQISCHKKLKELLTGV